MTPRKRFGIAAAVVGLAIAGLIAFALTGATAYYRTPAELLAAGANPTNQKVRVAGIVVKGTVRRDGADTSFQVEDQNVTLPVTTRAVLPDTFGDNVTVVAEGEMNAQGQFVATDVLAKCPSKFSAKVSST